MGKLVGYKALVCLLFLEGCTMAADAQITEKQLAPFIGEGYHLIDTSGPGLQNSSGDILLELGAADNPDVETLLLLRNTEGKLTKITENSNLLMGQEILGVSGMNYPSLSGGVLSVAYTLGSNSVQSDITLMFEKNTEGVYVFKTYTMVERNYGVENLFARQQITAQQTGTINFSEASESFVLDRAGVHPASNEAEHPVYKAAQRYAEYIPEGWQLAAYATGDLNLDSEKEDLLLVLYSGDECEIQLLTQQKSGGFQVAATNSTLLVPDETFNSNNLKAVVKNGYCTVEQRVPTGELDFDHRYLTFKYQAADKTWYLHRYDVEHFSGFNPQPAAHTTHLTPQQFGTLAFEQLDYIPGDYRYEPAVSTLSGTLTHRQFYGRPNDGETPEKDEKVWVYILQADYPVNVYAAPDEADPEIADKTQLGITELQVFSTDESIDLSNVIDKKVTLQGVLIVGRTGGQYTPVLLQVTRLLKSVDANPMLVHVLSLHRQGK